MCDKSRLMLSERIVCWRTRGNRSAQSQNRMRDVSNHVAQESQSTLSTQTTFIPPLFDPTNANPRSREGNHTHVISSPMHLMLYKKENTAASSRWETPPNKMYHIRRSLRSEKWFNLDCGDRHTPFNFGDENKRMGIFQISINHPLYTAEATKSSPRLSHRTNQGDKASKTA